MLAYMLAFNSPIKTLARLKKDIVEDRLAKFAWLKTTSSSAGLLEPEWWVSLFRSFTKPSMLFKSSSSFTIDRPELNVDPLCLPRPEGVQFRVQENLEMEEKKCDHPDKRSSNVPQSSDQLG